MRGEYRLLLIREALKQELPPRARRIPGGGEKEVSNPGTTSACAENTSLSITLIARSRNYLRVRGEYRLLLIREALKQELPPRARRIPGGGEKEVSNPGTTSACAENTVRDGAHS